MIAFIDDHRGEFGVEPICKVLPIAPSTYHAHAACRVDATRLPARARRDPSLKADIRRVHAANFGVYGVRKVWRQLGREGISVARCTVARLMRQMGLQGAVRGREVRTTVSNPAAACPLDRVNRQWDCPAFVDTLKLCPQGVPYAQNPFALCAGVPAPDDRVGPRRA